MLHNIVEKCSMFFYILYGYDDFNHTIMCAVEVKVQLYSSLPLDKTGPLVYTDRSVTHPLFPIH